MTTVGRPVKGFLVKKLKGMGPKEAGEKGRWRVSARRPMNVKRMMN